MASLPAAFLTSACIAARATRLWAIVTALSITTLSSHTWRCIIGGGGTLRADAGGPCSGVAYALTFAARRHHASERGVFTRKERIAVGLGPISPRGVVAVVHVCVVPLGLQMGVPPAQLRCRDPGEPPPSVGG